MLLLLADQKLYEAFTISESLAGDAALRADLGRTLGRIGDSRGRVILEELLLDSEPLVRREAAFSLGLLGDKRSIPALQSFAADPDRATGVHAVEALAKLDASLADVEKGLEHLSDEEFWTRIAPSLFRFPTAEALPLAARGFGVEDPSVRSRLIYALSRNPTPESAVLLRLLGDETDPWVRGWIARALGEVGDGDDLVRLRLLLDDPEPGPVVQALRAVERLISEGKVSPPDDWRPRIMELLEDERPAVRLEALDASGRWLLDADLSAILVQRTEAGTPYERASAIGALVEGEDPHAAEAVVRAAADEDPLVRIAAAEGADTLSLASVLERLATDEASSVRVAVAQTLIAGESEETAGFAREFLRDPDPVVRSVALEWLVENPDLSVGELLAAMQGPGGRRVIDVRLLGIRALVARGLSQSSERGQIVEILDEESRDKDYLVRRTAAKGLGQLDQPVPVVVPAARRGPQFYRDVLARFATPREIELHVRYGVVRIRLECDLAPMTCSNFLQLVHIGFYDGLSFHRVVPDFVVQGGDPRGDGWGGPGYAIRDEINLLRYDRGILGMALSEADSGGSQFFITLSAQPHLDGGYTAFGTVVEGMEYLDLVVPGDLIERIIDPVRSDPDSRRANQDAR